MELGVDSGLSHLSVVIVSYNTVGLLRDCLGSLMVGDGAQCEAIVVDNASGDGSAEMVEREFPAVHLIRNRENVGFGRASNQGMKVARGRHILLLNSDTIVHAGALASMSAYLSANPGTGGVACKLLNEDGTIQASISNRLGPVFLLLRLLGVSRLVAGDRARRWLARGPGSFLGQTVRSYLLPYAGGGAPREVENISAACLMLPREAIAAVGYFDERFFMYCEDVDYCLRLRRAGWKLAYLPGSAITHLSGRSSGGRMRNYSVHSYRALFQYYRKHFSRGMVLAVRAMVAALLSVRWAWNWLRSRFSSDPTYRRNEADLRAIIALCFAAARRSDS